MLAGYGARIRDIREALGMKQADFAARVRSKTAYAFSQSTLSKLESHR